MTADVTPSLNVLIVAHHQRPEAITLTEEARLWLEARGHRAWMTPEDAHALGLAHLASEVRPGTADLVLSLGGDGTILRTFQLLDGAPSPVIGVNVGMLGYLTEVEPPMMPAALERFVAGDFEIEQRMMLAVSVDRLGDDRGRATTWRSLNEAVLEKHESGHTVRLQVGIEGAPFTTYAADGLIIATPTGSTAYSLSARGPIVSPTHRAMVLTPVSPHMLFDRSLVLDPDQAVEVEVLGHRPVDLAVDGRKVASLVEGDTVRCLAAAEAAMFVRFGRRRFHQILKAKFGLADR
jgi:NAD+ kinase